MSGGPSPRFEKGLLSVELAKGAEIVRIHWQANGPVFFGPKPGAAPANRFDAPAGEFRVLYAAAELPGAYVETVLRRPYRVMRASDDVDPPPPSPHSAPWRFMRWNISFTVGRVSSSARGAVP